MQLHTYDAYDTTVLRRRGAHLAISSEWNHSQRCSTRKGPTKQICRALRLERIHLVRHQSLQTSWATVPRYTLCCSRGRIFAKAKVRCQYAKKRKVPFSRSFFLSSKARPVGRIPWRLCSCDDDLRVQTHIPGASTVTTANTRRGAAGMGDTRRDRDERHKRGPGPMLMSVPQPWRPTGPSTLSA